MSFSKSFRFAATLFGAGALCTGCLAPDEVSTENEVSPNTAAQVQIANDDYYWSAMLKPWEGGVTWDFGVSTYNMNNNQNVFFAQYAQFTNGVNRTWKLSAQGWDYTNVQATRVDIGGDGLAWVVDNNNQIFSEGPIGQFTLRGQGSDVGIGSNGAVWKLGSDAACAGCIDRSIYWWTGTGWYKVAGGGTSIDVDPTGRPWIVNSAGQVWKMKTESLRFEQVSGISANDIGIGATMNGVYVISREPYGNNYDFRLYRHLGGSSWAPTNGGGVRVSADYSDRPYIVANNGTVYQGSK